MSANRRHNSTPSRVVASRDDCQAVVNFDGAASEVGGNVPNIIAVAFTNCPTIEEVEYIFDSIIDSGIHKCFTFAGDHNAPTFEVVTLIGNSDNASLLASDEVVDTRSGDGSTHGSIVDSNGDLHAIDSCSGIAKDGLESDVGRSQEGIRIICHNSAHRADPIQELIASGRSSGYSHRVTNVVDTAAGDATVHWVVLGKSNSDLVGTSGLAELEVVDSDTIHIGAVPVTESEVDGLAGVGAEVNNRHMSGICQRPFLKQSEGCGVGCGGRDIEAIMFGRIKDILRIGVPSNLVVGVGGELELRSDQPVVGGKGTNVVLIRS